MATQRKAPKKRKKEREKKKRGKIEEKIQKALPRNEPPCRGHAKCRSFRK
jgi:hypothetical protein